MKTLEMLNLQLSDAVDLGRVMVEEWGPCIDRCANGMAILANGLKPVGCDTIVRIYPWLARIEACPWCEERHRREPGFISHELQYGMRDFQILRHPFVEHVLTGEICLDELVEWIRSIEPARENYGVPPGLRSARGSATSVEEPARAVV